MKRNILTSAILLLLVVSSVFFIDYLLIVAIGIIANAFNASAFFFHSIFPYIIALIIAMSIAYPLTAALLKKESGFFSKVHSIFQHDEEHTNGIHHSALSH